MNASDTPWVDAMSVPQPLATFVQGVWVEVESVPVAQRTYIFATSNGGDWLASTYARRGNHLWAARARHRQCGWHMSLAEKVLAAEFNREGYPVVSHYTYAFLGDGCLMEGISHEACSLAGTLKLGKLIALWDDNNISIDGHVDGWFADDTPSRFRAYGWHVIDNIDGQDAKQVAAALDSARSQQDKPTLLC